MFADLRETLETLFNEATKDSKYPSADSYVIDKPAYREAAMRPGGWANANLRTQFLKILRQAAKDSYLLVTDSHFQAAVKPNSCATGVLLVEKTADSCATGVLQTAETGGNDSQENNENTGENEKSHVSMALSSGGGGN